MKPMQRNNKKAKGDCFNCRNCEYHSEGDSYCDINFDFVLEDWTPTDKFNWCKGKFWLQN